MQNKAENLIKLMEDALGPFTEKVHGHIFGMSESSLDSWLSVWSGEVQNDAHREHMELAKECPIMRTAYKKLCEISLDPDMQAAAKQREKSLKG